MEVDKEFEELERKSKENPSIKEYKSILEKEPANLEVRFKLASLLFEMNLHEESIENCLEVNF